MTNYTYPRAIILVAFMISLAFGALANNPFSNIILKKNTSYTSTTIDGFSEIVTNHPDHGSVNLMNASGGFKVSYSPDSGYTGRDTIVVEYLSGGTAPSIAYAVFTFDVRHSILNINDDYFAVSANSDYQYYDLADNDSGSDDPISVSDVVAVMGGYAYVSNDSFYFKPKVNFTGMAAVSYRACDTLGYCGNGQAKFIVVDSSNIASEDTLELYTAENVDLTLLMPDTGFSLSINPSLGVLMNDLNGQVFTYQPLQNATGTDTFKLMNPANLMRYVIVHIIDVPNENSRVVPDYIYTHKNTSVSFDVLDNDIINSGRVSSYSSVNFGTLNKINSREFEYIPDAGFEGVDQFTYTTCVNGAACETGVVKIYVGNLNPENHSNYELVTPKNRPIVINYEVPISNFSFDLTMAPQNGQIDIYPGYDTLLIGCEDVRGHNLVVYTPDSNYVGFDEFDLEYCVDSSSCQIVKVKVDVLDMQLDSVCVCVDDCVWPGDVDYDGEVGMLDLLSLGWHMGSEGNIRPYAEPNDWYGQYCPDWNQSQTNDENLKHADIDGDGMITLSDTAGISNFYNKVHALLAEPIFEPAEFPVSLEIESPTNPQIGDFVLVNVVAGSEAYPAVNLHGMHLNLDFDPNVIDTSSLVMSFIPNSWILNSDVCIDLVKRNGVNIQGGLSRIDGVSRSGFGVIAQVGFIVEDDLDGIRLEDGILDYEIELSNSSVMLGNGRLVRLEKSSVPLRIPIQRDIELPQTENLIVFPNPAPEQLNLMLNGGNEIQQVQIYDFSGRLVWDQNNINSRSHQINTSVLNEGMYILKTYSTSGFNQSEKIQIIR